jgi:hypothetical protein
MLKPPSPPEPAKILDHEIRAGFAATVDTLKSELCYAPSSAISFAMKGFLASTVQLDLPEGSVGNLVEQQYLNPACRHLLDRIGIGQIRSYSAHLKDPPRNSDELIDAMQKPIEHNLHCLILADTLSTLSDRVRALHSKNKDLAELAGLSRQITSLKSCWDNGCRLAGGLPDADSPQLFDGLEGLCKTLPPFNRALLLADLYNISRTLRSDHEPVLLSVLAIVKKLEPPVLELLQEFFAKRHGENLLDWCIEFANQLTIQGRNHPELFNNCTNGFVLEFQRLITQHTNSTVDLQKLTGSLEQDIKNICDRCNSPQLR